MRTIIKILTNGRVITAVISSLGAIISAFFAGCRLSFGEMGFQDFKAEIFSSYYQITNSIQEIK